MRCPKCGYISFDHMDSCLKCTKQIIETTSDLRGTTFNAAPPSFLSVFSENQELKQEPSAGDEYGEIGIADSDFDVSSDAEGDEAFGDELSFDEFDMGESLPESGEHIGGNDDEIAMEDIDDDMTMDLGQFADELEDETEDETEDELADDFQGLAIDPDQIEDELDNDQEGIDSNFGSLEDDFISEEVAEDESQNAPAIDITEELTDITDLASPADDMDDFLSLDDDFSLMEEEEKESVHEDVSTQGMESENDAFEEIEMADDGLAGLDIDGLDLDLSDDISDSILPEGDISQEHLNDVSLSEIDLSGTVGSEVADKKDQQDTSNGDPDLDFELVLDGLALPKE